MDPQRRPAWSPFFNAECAVEAHSRQTLVAMSKIRRLVPYILVLLIGVLLGYATQAILPRERSTNSENFSHAFIALVKVAEAPIPQAALSCEAAGPSKSVNGDTVYPDTKVKDIIASYLAWSQERSSHSFSRLACEGSNVKQCTWQFGEAKANEGWSRNLRFAYDTKSNSVVPQSLGCSDVP